MRPPGTKQLEDTATARPVSYAAFIERTAAVMREQEASSSRRLAREWSHFRGGIARARTPRRSVAIRWPQTF